MNNKQELTIKIFCIIILLILNIAIYINGKNLDCNKCQIKFRIGNEIMEVNANKLFDKYLNNDCNLDYNQLDYYEHK